ncbi:hypothetical protein D3C87_1612040 [compost metagenome]
MHQAVGRLLGVGGLQAVVFDDQLHGHAAQLAAAFLDGQVEGIALVFADVAGRRGQGGDEADLDGLCGARGAHRNSRAQRDGQRGGHAAQFLFLDHVFPLKTALPAWRQA